MEERIVFECNNVIIYNKAVGEDSEKLGEMMGKELFVINRLDKPVSGLICLAKNPKAAAFLNKQVQDKTISKTYYAIVLGRLDSKGELKDLLLHDKRKNKSFVVNRERKGVKDASLDYEVLREIEREGEIYSLVRVNLHTGRTHQIRVQFASRKHSLVGDGKYGSRVKGDIRLMSCRLSLTLPGDSERRTFEIPYNDEFISF
ncbi:MAG: RNA pseudouridine synthase [Clostridia bacterium]|nr:RNA pseudouridine synthase [Clostridia bacterium]